MPLCGLLESYAKVISCLTILLGLTTLAVPFLGSLNACLPFAETVCQDRCSGYECDAAEKETDREDLPRPCLPGGLHRGLWLGLLPSGPRGLRHGLLRVLPVLSPETGLEEGHDGPRAGESGEGRGLGGHEDHGGAKPAHGRGGHPQADPGSKLMAKGREAGRRRGPAMGADWSKAQGRPESQVQASLGVWLSRVSSFPRGSKSIDLGPSNSLVLRPGVSRRGGRYCCSN
ncbi:unnamed protein product, partial [Effrenium voratum]